MLPVLAEWSPCAPLGGYVFGAFWVGGLGRLLRCWSAVWWLWAALPPPPRCFFSGGFCLFLPLPSLVWRTHWPTFSVVFRVAVGGCVLLGCVPAPWVGLVMYTLGLALGPWYNLIVALSKEASLGPEDTYLPTYLNTGGSFPRFRIALHSVVPVCFCSLVAPLHDWGVSSL